MSIGTQELIEICEKLPETQLAEVADFARFLLSKQDEAWERTIADPSPRPKLEAFLKESRSEQAEPLDLDRL